MIDDKFKDKKKMVNDKSETMYNNRSSEFNPEQFGGRVAALAALVKTYQESGVADFRTLVTRMAERFPEKFGDMKPLLPDIWNAVARAYGLPRVSDEAVREVYESTASKTSILQSDCLHDCEERIKNYRECLQEWKRKKQEQMDSTYCSACGKKLENTDVAPEQKVTSMEVSDASIVCELCGAKATKEVKFDMYIIDDSHYVPLSGRSFRYRSKKEKVQLCDACYSSITRYDCILAIIALTSWIGLFSFLASFGIDGVSQFIMVGVLSFLLIGLPLAPLIFIFSSERRTGRKVERIKNMLKKWWKFGKKPTKADIFSP